MQTLLPSFPLWLLEQLDNGKGKRHSLECSAFVLELGGTLSRDDILPGLI